MKPSDRAIAMAFREYHGGPAFEAATRRIENRAAEIQRTLDAQPSEWPEADACLIHWPNGDDFWRPGQMRAIGDGNMEQVPLPTRETHHLRADPTPLYARPTVERLLAEREASKDAEILEVLDAADPDWRQIMRPNLTGSEAVLYALRDIAGERKLLRAESASLRAQLAGRVAVPEGVRRYVECRARVPMLGGDDVIHAVHTGTEHEAELRLSDLRTMLAAPEPAQASPSMPEFGDAHRAQRKEGE